VLLIQVIRHEFDKGTLAPGLLAGLSDRHLSLALTAIHDEAHKPWTLESLAAVACMSRTAFTEHFRTVMGVPPGEYLTRWRITHGGRLLRQGMAIKLVCAHTGYASASAFTRAFTALMGMSPREWRKQAA
jgi:AraC-like DNA-binding protein